MSERVEFTAAEWKSRPERLRHRRAIHGCGVWSKRERQLEPLLLARCAVFKCRSRGGRFACGRYVGACVGGSDDNRCADCWVKYWKDVERRIIRFVRAADRRETTLCKRFGRTGFDDDGEIEDLLFAMVKEGKLEWFGERKVLRYRIPLCPAPAGKDERK